MNSKLAKASLAGIAAIAVAAGGTTFAAWSDLETVDNNVTTAGHLNLDLNSTGSIQNVASKKIAPGENRTIDFFVASADLDGVPSAALSMTIKNLVDNENGCATGSEKAVDNCDLNGAGEFSQQAYARIRYTAPADMGLITFAKNNCSAPGGYTNSIGYAPASNNDTEAFPKLNTLTASSPLGTLSGDQGVCVRIDLGLPVSANNATQGDSSEFDLQFDLVQS